MAERALIRHGAADTPRLTPVRVGLQVVCYALFGLLVGYFADSPAYRYLARDSAVVKLSFNHAAAHVTACRRRTASELAALAPNMRQPAKCPRARVAVRVELDLDGRRLFGAELSPGGLAKDGEASIYRRFTLPAGRHRLTMRLRDSRRKAGFDYQREVTVDFTPGELFVIDFNPQAGGFQFPASKPVDAIGGRFMQPTLTIRDRVEGFRNAFGTAFRSDPRGS